MRSVPRWFRRFPPLLALVALSASPAVRAGIDHPVTPTNSGIWAHKYTQALQYGVIATEAGGALWLGGQSELGLTFWQTIGSLNIFSLQPLAPTAALAPLPY
jgi:hypothetical protein